MSSDKTPVIELLWQKLQAERPPRRLVLQRDITAAINRYNRSSRRKLSVNNPANFMKDIVRSDNASAAWPKKLTRKKIGARQRPGGKRVFEFVDFDPGQTEPFPNPHMPAPRQRAIPLQSISMPLASTRLGRKDETWLIQVTTHLKVIEQHFATKSALDVKQIVHLQMGVKLSKSEIDSLFLADVYADGLPAHVLITCEAKQEGQRILEDQIIEQVVAAYKSIKKLDLEIKWIVPIAIKAIPPHGDIFIVEFAPWSPESAEVAEAEIGKLQSVSNGLYRLHPSVPGVGYQKPKQRPRRAR